MATTRAVLRERVVQLGWGQHLTFTTTSAGGDNTSVISTDIINFELGSDTDGYARWWALITAGTNAGEYKRITAYAKATGDCTVASGFTNNVENTKTGELLPVDPEIIHDCIDWAGEAVYPDIYLPAWDETLMANGLGSNMDFETWTTTPGAPDDWTADTNATISKETTRKFHGSNASKIVGGSADDGFYQDLTVNQAAVVGHSIVFGGLLWSTTASAVWFQVDFGGSDTNDSTKVTGDEDWEHQFVSAAIPSTASQIRLRCVGASGSTGYHDALYSYIRPIQRYALPTAFYSGPSHIYIQTNREKLSIQDNYSLLTNWKMDNEGETRYIRFGEQLSGGYRLRLKGRAPLSLPTTDATSMEISRKRVNAVAEMATAELFRRLAAGAGAQDAAEDYATSDRHMANYFRLIKEPGVKMRSHTVQRYPAVIA